MTRDAKLLMLLRAGADGAPDAGPLSRIRTDGRCFVAGAGTFRPVFASALSILTKSPDQRAAVLDEYRDLGFNGVRVFAGALTWAGQTPESARAALPQLLVDAAACGLYVFVSANTDSRSGYDVESHTRVQADTCDLAVNSLLEIANEPYHATQSSDVNDTVWLMAMARRAVPSGLPYCLGAAGVDEPDMSGWYPTAGGAYNTAHLDRGRDKWNMIRRLREIAAIRETTGKPAMSGEPIGAAEVAIPGKRESDPSVFFVMGALCRGFEIGCVFHSEDGLHARLLGPNQRTCAMSCIAGFRALDTDERLTFLNAGWSNSPIASADFARVVRAYSFVHGDRGYTVLVGLTGDPRLDWQNGWRAVRVVAERPGVQVIEIAR